MQTKRDGCGEIRREPHISDLYHYHYKALGLLREYSPTYGPNISSGMGRATTSIDACRWLRLFEDLGLAEEAEPGFKNGYRWYRITDAGREFLERIGR